MTDFLLSWTWSAGWFWLGIPCLLLLAWWMYYRTVPVLPKPLRWLLILLRSLVLILLLFLLWNPVLQVNQRFTQPPETAVLIDASLSMAFPAAKVDSTRRWLELLLKPFAATRVNYYLCGDTLLPLGDSPPETLPNNQAYTNLTQGLEQLDAAYLERNLQAVVLLSDGGINRGSEPARASLPPVPIHVVGIGDTLATPDALLSDLEVKPVLQPGDTATVTVKVTARGLEGESGELRLTLGGETLKRRRLQLPADQFPLHEQFRFVPEQAGRSKLRIELVTTDREESTRNNSLADYIDIQENRRQVLLIAGAPSFDLEMISFLLGQREETTVTTWLLTPSSQPPSVTTAPDLVIIIDFPLPATSNNDLNQVIQRIAGLPALWIPGPAVDPARTAELAGWPQLATRTAPTLQFPQPEQVHPVLGQEVDLLSLQQHWRELPPIVSQYQIAELPSHARVLLAAGTDSDRPLLVVKDEPGQLRQGWLLARDCWQWHFQMQAVSPGNSVYTDLLDELVRWLTVTVTEKLLQVKPLQEIFQENQTVRFQGRVTDDSRQPTPGADLTLSISSDSLTTSYRLSDGGDGRYYADLGQLPIGDYRYQVSGSRGDYLLPPDSGQFAVEPFSIELRTSALNTAPLRRLAAVSGGLYLNEAPAGWVEELQFYDRINQTQQDHLLRNKWLLLGVILLLLSLEWFLRKYFHML